MNYSLIKQNLIIAVASTIGVGIIFTVHIATAAPTQSPPLGNPGYAQGTQGPTGDRGNTGSKGSKGSTGNSGSKGANGAPGMGICNWSGATFVSHGWDGACAWDTGAYFFCSGNRLVSVSAVQNVCGWVF